MSPRKTKYQRAMEEASAFNKRYRPGTPVVFWLGTRASEPLTSRTRGEAWALPSGETVVRVEGRAGGIDLARVEVIAAVAAAEDTAPGVNAVQVPA